MHDSKASRVPWSLPALVVLLLFPALPAVYSVLLSPGDAPEPPSLTGFVIRALTGTDSGGHEPLAAAFLRCLVFLWAGLTLAGNPRFCPGGAG
ncbi:MAG: hypothetical protein AB1758_31370, partial [Candidatus Eremiobacterota bacterium]